MSAGDAAGPDFDVPSGRAFKNLTPSRRTQRSRLRKAVTAEVARCGYDATSVTAIVAAARVSRTVFYDLYDGKDHCLLDAYMSSQRILYRDVRALSPGGVDLNEFFVRAVDFYLALSLGDPVISRAFLVELYRVGPAAQRAHRVVLETWADLIVARMTEAFRADPTLAVGRREPSRLSILAGLYGVTDLLKMYAQDGHSTVPPELRSESLRLILGAVSESLEGDRIALEKRYPAIGDPAASFLD